MDNVFSNSRLTVRLELRNVPGIFASVVDLLAQEGANLGAVDIVEATREHVVRDVTFDVTNEEHGQMVISKLQKLPHVKLISASDPIFLMHLGGKIRVRSKISLKTRNHLSMVYTPGVAKVSEAIARDPAKAYSLTIKSNSVAVITDGSAVLGLGNLGPKAALPVMEGKAMIFREFAGIDAWPICLDTQDPQKIIETVCHIAPVFGGINLEDISSPRCFEIEEELKKRLDIPVMHDDQHGTAVVILAALINALKIVDKNFKKVKMVVMGMGAAGVACCRILSAAGIENILGCNRKGVIFMSSNHDPKTLRENFFSCLHRENPVMTLREALHQADVFIGLSVGNLLTPETLDLMNKDAIVFAMANPEPEINPYQAARHCRIFATGRSDFPNQINNALAFPGIFRGALNVHAKEINESMKLAAAFAIANLVKEDHLNEEYIIPSIFNKAVVSAVTEAVEQTAYQTGVAQRRNKNDNSAIEAIRPQSKLVSL